MIRRQRVSSAMSPSTSPRTSKFKRSLRQDEVTLETHQTAETVLIEGVKEGRD